MKYSQSLVDEIKELKSAQVKRGEEGGRGGGGGRREGRRRMTRGGGDGGGGDTRVRSRRLRCEQEAWMRERSALLDAVKQQDGRVKTPIAGGGKALSRRWS
eukprot:662784-Hanusia_phi.AAC.1